jgi:hypothetical protein
MLYCMRCNNTYWCTWRLRLQSNCDRWGNGRRWTAWPGRRSWNRLRTNYGGKPPKKRWESIIRKQKKKKNKKFIPNVIIIIKIDSTVFHQGKTSFRYMSRL